MTTNHSPQHWLASGLFLGSLLVLAVVMFIPQPQADPFIYLGLAAGLILVAASLATFVGIHVRRLFRNRSLESTDYGNAVRQGLEFAILLVAGLLLWGFNGLTWWEAGLLVAAVAFAEIALGMKKNPFAKETA